MRGHSLIMYASVPKFCVRTKWMTRNVNPYVIQTVISNWYNKCVNISLYRMTGQEF